MTSTPFLGLPLTPAADDQKKFLVFRTEIAGDSDNSALMKIDNAVKGIDEKADGLATHVSAIEDTKFTWGMLKDGLSDRESGNE